MSLLCGRKTTLLNAKGALSRIPSHPMPLQVKKTSFFLFAEPPELALFPHAGEAAPL